MRKIISKKIFTLLHDQIMRKCQTNEEFDLLGKGEALYGFGRFKDDSEIPSIRNQMARTASIKKILESRTSSVINGKYLYDRIREARKPKTTFIELSTFYEKIFTLFIGFNSLEEYIEAAKLTESLTSEDLHYTNAISSSSSSLSALENAEKFQGYYYSKKHKKVRHFELDIDQQSKKAELSKLHDTLTESGADASIYSGKMELIGPNLRFELENKLNKHQKCYLILHNDHFPLHSLAFIKGIFLGISTFDHPFSSETLVTSMNKDEGSGEWNPHEKKAELAAQYLNLQQHSIYNRSSPILENIALKPYQKPLNALQPLVGYYNVWSFSYYSDEATIDQIKLYKSKFEVLEDYTSFLISAYGYDENSDKIALNCFLSLTEISNVNFRNPKGTRKVSVTARDEDSHIKSHAMMTIPPFPPTAPDKLEKFTADDKKAIKNSYRNVKGVYSSFGTRRRPFLATAVLFERLGFTEKDDCFSLANQSLAQTQFAQSEAKTYTAKEMMGKDGIKKELYEEIKKHYKNTSIEDIPEKPKMN